MGNESNSRTTFLKAIAACVVVALTFGIAFIGEYNVNRSESDSDASGNYTPGTYTASAAGIDSDVTVTCTFDESGITDVSVDVSGETAGIGADIGDEMTQQFLDAQSADVDGVSGATITSTALKDAMADCIAQASGEGGSDEEVENEIEETEEAAETESAGEDIEEAEETEEPAEAESAGEDIEEAEETEEPVETETAGEDTEEAEETEEFAETEDAGEDIEEAEETEEPAETETAGEDTEEAGDAEDAGTGIYTPGTYTASAAGIDSDVSVACTFDESGITAVAVDVSGETAGIGADIGDEMIHQFLDAQSADVDGVSGATITSTALKNAMAECIAQASGESGSDEGSEAETEKAKTDGIYTPGTYSASAQGDSEISVSVTFTENEILSISYDLSGESSNIGLEMSSAILNAQSADVDDIDGAEETSAAFKEAVNDCIAQAATGEE